MKKKTSKRRRARAEGRWKDLGAELRTMRGEDKEWAYATDITGVLRTLGSAKRVSQQDISNYENGQHRPPAIVLAAMARYGTSQDDGTRHCILPQKYHGLVRIAGNGKKFVETGKQHVPGYANWIDSLPTIKEGVLKRYAEIAQQHVKKVPPSRRARELRKYERVPIWIKIDIVFAEWQRDHALRRIEELERQLASGHRLVPASPEQRRRSMRGAQRLLEKAGIAHLVNLQEIFAEENGK
jgi:hypothetical protein